jgi:hypothetical protein
MLKQFVVAMALAWCLSAIPAAYAQSEVPMPADANYVHAPSGMTFPAMIGPFQRANAGRLYTPSGDNVGVSYSFTSSSGGYVQATIFVYPAANIASGAVVAGDIATTRAQQCAAEHGSVAREVASVHPHAVMVENGAAQITQGGVAYAGHTLAFTIDSPSRFGTDHPTLRSEAYLFCYAGGRWNVKYRFTYVDQLQEESGVEQFMRDLIWTIAAEQT